MLTIAPAPCASMIGSTALQVRKTEVRLTSSTRRQLASLASAAPPGRLMPTLLCRTSIRPQRAITASTAAAIAPASVTSAARAAASPPSPAITAAVASAAAGSMSTQATRPPSRA